MLEPYNHLVARNYFCYIMLVVASTESICIPVTLFVTMIITLVLHHFQIYYFCISLIVRLVLNLKTTTRWM